MTKKIEIKPNDQSYVGTKLRWSGWTTSGSIKYLVVKYVGRSELIADWYYKDDNFKIGVSSNLASSEYHWELYKEECSHNLCYRDTVNNTDVCKACYRVLKIRDFWLNPGDLVANRKHGGSPMRIKFLDYDLQIATIERVCGYKDKMNYTFDFKYLSKANYKKIKLVAPAMLKSKALADTGFSSIAEESYQLSIKSYSERPKSITEYTGPYAVVFTDFLWPARDQYGHEIWYEVEDICST